MNLLKSLLNDPQAVAAIICFVALIAGAGIYVRFFPQWDGSPTTLLRNRFLSPFLILPVAILVMALMFGAAFLHSYLNRP